MVEYAEGHGQALGTGIKDSEFDNFIKFNPTNYFFSMKHIIFIWAFFSLVVFGNAFAMTGNTNLSPSDNGKSSLELAFEKISGLAFHQTFDESDDNLKHMLPNNLGKGKAVICGNSFARQDIISFLGEIPSSLLFCECRDARNKIVRCYILNNVNYAPQMLYAFLGHGGNDVVVAFFEGASIDEYVKFSTFLKFTMNLRSALNPEKPEYDTEMLRDDFFERAKKYIDELNSNPLWTDEGEVARSYVLSTHYCTINIEVETELSNLTKEQLKSILQRCTKKRVLSDAFNLNIPLYVNLSNLGEQTKQFVLERNDLAQILNTSY